MSHFPNDAQVDLWRVAHLLQSKNQTSISKLPNILEHPTKQFKSPRNRVKLWKTSQNEKWRIRKRWNKKSIKLLRSKLNPKLQNQTIAKERDSVAVKQCKLISISLNHKRSSLKGTLIFVKNRMVRRGKFQSEAKWLLWNLVLKRRNNSWNSKRRKQLTKTNSNNYFRY